MEPSYEHAIKILESRQRRARPTATGDSAKQSASGTPGLRGTPSIEGMSEWLHILGYSLDDLASLNVIHVAGTKGKGSTCAFIESILRAHGQRTGYPLKTGLYTSPHLMVPEERIRINSHPLEPDKFAQYLFEVNAKLPQSSPDASPSYPSPERVPRYLQLLFLLALHVFLRERVDLAIIETHSGGEYDATNLLHRPRVTAITTLALDHIAMLGPAIANIAWHKAGIFKPGAAALSTLQGEEGAGEVLRRRAGQKGVALAFVGEDPDLPVGSPRLEPPVQRQNASLAVAACRAWLRQQQRTRSADAQLSAADIEAGIAQFAWPGRFQTVTVPAATHPSSQTQARTTFHLDAAHNTLSIRLAAQWFAALTSPSSSTNATVTRVLLFTHINALRDAEGLLLTLAHTLSAAGVAMDGVVFTTYHPTQGAVDAATAAAAAATQAESDGVQAATDGRVPPSFLEIWRSVFPTCLVEERAGIAEAVECARRIGATGSEGGGTTETHVLVTGSQHLVGPVLRILEAERTGH